MIPQGSARPAVGNRWEIATSGAPSRPRDAEIPLANVRPAPKPALARPPPTRQTVRKGRLNFEQTDGVLFLSENFQALSRMQSRYREQTRCAFNDPPYNTSVDGFPYKDAYEHSSWLSMIEGRLSLVRSLLSQVVITAASQSRNPEVAI